MSLFKSKLKVELADKAQSFILTQALVYDDGAYQITVKEGFDFDGATIPSWLWSIIGSPIGELYSRGACLHDALYASQGLKRAACDDLFYKAIRADGTGFIRAKLMYRAVRLAGSRVYADTEDLAYYKSLIEIIKK